MIKYKLTAFGVAAVICLLSLCCAGRAERPLVDPSAVKFPLVESGTLEIEGTVVGQPRARDGIVYFATREGFLTAVVVPARQVFWRFKAEHAISASPELGENHLFLRDDGNVLYVLDTRGSLVFEKPLGEAVTSAVREYGRRVYFGTAGGNIRALDISADGVQAWEYRAAAAISAGPVFSGDLVLFGAADGRLIALDRAGKLAWEFIAKGGIAADPAIADGRLYFGTKDRLFYCLNTEAGKKIWARRIQGAPLHPTLIHGRRLVVPASNSVIYFISRRGGSILSWEAVPSRIVYEISEAGPLILVSSAGPLLVAYDFVTGKRIGQQPASNPLAAGAIWVSPFVVIVVGSEQSGCQRLVFLSPKPAAASAAPGDRSPGY